MLIRSIIKQREFENNNKKENFMKENHFFLFVVILIVTIMNTMSCSSDDGREGVMSFFSQSGCKKAVETRVTGEETTFEYPLEAIESFIYEGTTDGSLKLIHKNGRFTCEASITCTVKVTDGTISIIESYIPSTNCICCYDLTMKISNLKPGRYNVVIYNDSTNGKYVPTVSYANFFIDYNTDVKGEYILMN